MNSGKEYEKFVYEKFKIFYKDFKVTLDDEIIGKESGVKRQIDVSIKGKVDNIDLLYIVQCKDHKTRPADITIIGEFSSVIRDIGASKGFLICTSGFTKTIHQYAKTVGIELLTVEDINSDEWKAEIEIPIVYIRKKGYFQFSSEITANQALIEKNKTELQISKSDFEELSFNKGKTTIKLLDYINQKIESEKLDMSVIKELKLTDPNLLLKFSGIWVPAKFHIHFLTEKTYFLKYLRPAEYYQITDHIAKGIIPLKLLIKNFMPILDNNYTEVDKNNLPISTNFNLEIEENLFPISNLIFSDMGVEI